MRIKGQKHDKNLTAFNFGGVMPKLNKEQGFKMKVTDETYYKGKDCEFRADGKLRGGEIIAETGDNYKIVYHCPHYREIELPKNKVKVWDEEFQCHV